MPTKPEPSSAGDVELSGEVHTILINGFPVVATANAFIVPHVLIYEEFRNVAGPAIHKKLSSNEIYRTQPPLRTTVRLFPVARALILGGRDSRKVSADDELELLLGSWVQKLWSDASVARIKVPFILSSGKHDKLKISFCCEIKNRAGLLQYPLQYN